MTTGIEEEATQSPVLELSELIQSGTYQEIKSLADALKAEDLADVLESSPPVHRSVLWNICETELQSEILQHIDEELTPELLSDKPVGEIKQVLENVDADDLADILQQLPNTLTQQVLQAMDAQDRRRVENLLSYSEDTGVA